MEMTKIKTKPILSDWLLLTYDIPHTRSGDKARRKFLKRAKRIGAEQHTESVYLLPWTNEGERIAENVAKIGRAFIWTTSMGSKEQAREVTRAYDKGIKIRLGQIGERIDRIEEHIQKRPKLAHKMAVRTREMVGDLEAAVVRRGSNELYRIVLGLRKRLETL